MQRPLIPFSILRDLRCRHCQNFVSCGPVYVVPDESILCGRCQHLAKDIYRNTSYEALASMFMYPCYNWEDHCSSILQWNESLQHEEECSYNGCCMFFCHHPRAYCKGKREMPYGEVRLSAVPEHLLDYIKCVQCECYLSCDPVYIQTNGRNICHRCIHANGIPPNCLRNLAYERLSTIVVFPCIFRNRGCPTRLKFGRSLWQHEAECSYGQIHKKISKNPTQKEKGVIKTHSGHYYGTLTPNGALFAPPTQKTDFDMNKELIKSLKKQQERRFLRADEIGTQMDRMNSEDGSITTEDSEKKNSYDRDSYSEISSPTRSNDSRLKFNYNNLQPYQGEANYRPPSRSPQPPNEHYQQQNIYIAQVHQEDYHTPKISRHNSYNRQQSNMYMNGNLNKRNDESASPKPSFRKPLSSVDSNILAGHYPVFMYSKALQHSPSNTLQENVFFNGGFNNDYRVSRTESMNSNKELIEELKIKLKKNNSMKTPEKPAADSPYKECNNLEDILQAHDRISQ